MGGRNVGGAAPAVGGSPDMTMPGGEAGAVNSVSAGAGGQAPACDQVEVAATLDLDTWIDEVSRKTSWPDDPVLSVVGSPGERRALLQLSLPAAPVNAELRGASLRLHLESNADPAARVRQLAVHSLSQSIDADASWTNAVKNRKWSTEGGDFGPQRAELMVPEGASNVTVAFDVTDLVRGAVGATPVSLSLVVLEIGVVPPAPAQLAFTSSEGDASNAPRLSLTYCEP